MTALSCGEKVVFDGKLSERVVAVAACIVEIAWNGMLKSCTTARGSANTKMTSSLWAWTALSAAVVNLDSKAVVALEVGGVVGAAVASDVRDGNNEGDSNLLDSAGVGGSRVPTERKRKSFHLNAMFRTVEEMGVRRSRRSREPLGLLLGLAIRYSW